LAQKVYLVEKPKLGFKKSKIRPKKQFFVQKGRKAKLGQQKKLSKKAKVFSLRRVPFTYYF